MTSRAQTSIEAGPAAPETGGAAKGWYLYGITRRAPLAAALAVADDGPAFTVGAMSPAGDDPPLQLLEFGGLAAVVRPVLLAEFSLAVVQERQRSAAVLEEMVRSHNRVVEAVHARQAILPAKFGSVYADTRDLASALGPEHDALLRQLDRLEGCDEWAVHLYADSAVVRKRIAAEDPAIRLLREEYVAARPGRAYFLDRQIRDEVEAATREALVTIAQTAFDRLAEHAVAAQVNPAGPVPENAEETEILRASFLVSRDVAARFEEGVHSTVDAGEGLRCDYSGPWPPYSFAARDAEEAR
jgi:hypothetical protein